MRKFYSAIVMKNGDLLHDVHVTSHEDLIALFNIRDNKFNCDKFVRVEFTPKDSKDFADIDKYRLNVDEDSVPDWFEKHREDVTRQLTDIVSKRIITGNHKIILGGLYVVKDAQIAKLKQATVVYMQNSSVVEMLGNSSVVEMLENSSVGVMLGNSIVGNHNSSNPLPKK